MSDGEFVTIRIKTSDLENHVQRICRGNLKRPAKICQQCPILGPVIQVMEQRNWSYNREAMKEAIESYHKRYG